MHYTTKGSGPHRTLVLHGFLGSGRNLTSFAQKWSERDPTRTIYLCDLLGHGQSPPLPKSPTLFSLVPPILALIDEVPGSGPAGSGGPSKGGVPHPRRGTKQVTLVGHSLGGRAALVAACERKVEQVMLLDISPAPIGVRNAGLEQMMRAFLAAPAVAESRAEMRVALLGSGLSEPSADWLLMNLTPAEAGGLKWRVDRQALAELGAATRGDDLWAYAEKVAHKLRAIYGTASPFVQPADVDRLQRLGVDVRAIEGAGHYLHVDALPALLDTVSR